MGRMPQLPSSMVTVPKTDVFPSEDSDNWLPYTDSGVSTINPQPSRIRAVSLRISMLCEISNDVLLSFYDPTPGGPWLPRAARDITYCFLAQFSGPWLPRAASDIYFGFLARFASPWLPRAARDITYGFSGRPPGPWLPQAVTDNLYSFRDGFWVSCCLFVFILYYSFFSVRYRK